MSELQEYEVELFYDSLKYANRPEWEQTRLLMYILAQVNSKKKLEITDLMKFPWDDNYEETSREYNEEEHKRLREKALMMEKMLQAQNKKDSE